MGTETLKFKLDTGAEVTAISHHAYKQLSTPPPLYTPEKVLYGPPYKCWVSANVTSFNLAARVDMTPDSDLIAGAFRSNFLRLLKAWAISERSTKLS